MSTTNRDLDCAIVEWCGWLKGGKRIKHVKPNGYSIEMGSSDGEDYQTWAVIRVEHALLKLPNLQTRRDMTDLLIERYWDHRGSMKPARFLGVLDLGLRIFRRELRKEMEANPRT